MTVPGGSTAWVAGKRSFKDVSARSGSALLGLALVLCSGWRWCWCCVGVGVGVLGVAAFCPAGICGVGVGVGALRVAAFCPIGVCSVGVGNIRFLSEEICAKSCCKRTKLVLVPDICAKNDG